jgi:hypothetical protein
MYKSIKAVVILIGVFVIVVFSSQLPTWSERVVLGGIGIVGFTILTILVGERVRRVVEGYYTFMRGGAEDGDLVYVERGNALRLYFKRRPHRVYVPSNVMWVEIMPEWAKANKNLIMKRIESQVGKHWMFEDTEKRELILTQKQ